MEKLLPLWLCKIDNNCWQELLMKLIAHGNCRHTDHQVKISAIKNVHFYTILATAS